MVSRGRALTSPAIHPTAPAATASSTMSSRPAKTARRSPQSAFTAVTRRTSPLDSFTACRFVVLARELVDVRRQEVGLVRRRVVVEHAREPRGAQHRLHVRLHLAPVRAVHVRRQDHEAAAARLLRRLRERHGLRGAERRDAGDERLAAHRADEGLQDGDLLLEAERRRLAEGAERDDAVDAAVELPPGVLRHESVVDGVVGLERGGDRGDDARPFHVRFPFSGSDRETAGSRRCCVLPSRAFPRPTGR